MNNTEKPKMPRSVAKRRDRSQSRAREQLGSLGIDTGKFEERLSRIRTKRDTRSASRKRAAESDRTEKSVVRSISKQRPTRDQSGIRDAVQLNKAKSLAKSRQRPWQLDARKGEGDRHVFDLKPKHLFSGKRGIGKTQRR